MLTDSKHFARLFVSIYIFCALTEHNPDFIASSSVSASRNVAVQCTRTKHSQLPLCVFIHFETNATSVHERFHTTHTRFGYWIGQHSIFRLIACLSPLQQNTIQPYNSISMCIFINITIPNCHIFHLTQNIIFLRCLRFTSLFAAVDRLLFLVLHRSKI